MYKLASGGVIAPLLNGVISLLFVLSLLFHCYYHCYFTAVGVISLLLESITAVGVNHCCHMVSFTASCNQTTTRPPSLPQQDHDIICLSVAAVTTMFVSCNPFPILTTITTRQLTFSC